MGTESVAGEYTLRSVFRKKHQEVVISAQQKKAENVLQSANLAGKLEEITKEHLMGRMTE